MKREELVDALTLVSPALSKNNLVPILKMYWFQNDVLMAFNDQIAIQTKLMSNFAGAIPDTLVALVKASRAKDVEFNEMTKGQLVIKAASGKFKLPFLPDEATKIFEMPEPDSERNALPVDMDAFLEAIGSCMLSLKEDPSMPDSLGITLVHYDENRLHFYATNDATISYSSIDMKPKDVADTRVVLSGSFCRQMLSIAKLEGEKHVEIRKDYSLFQCGDTVLFGRLVDVPKPLDFEAVVQSSLSKEAENNLVSIPTKLELMLDRACVIGDKTSIVVEKGVAKFLSKSDRGEVRDQVSLEAHPDVSININPRLFRNGFGKFDKMLLTDTCLVMSQGTNLYLVSASM